MSFLSILLSNCALFVYFLLIYWATARILAVKARNLSWMSGLCLAVLLPIAFYTFIRPNIVARILLSGSTAVIIATMTALLLLGQKSPKLRTAVATLASVHVISAALYLGRSIISVLHPPVHFVTGDWIQTSFTYGQMLVRLAICCGTLWLTVCVHQTDLEQIAMSDSLTLALNRRAFDALLTREAHRSRFTGASFGLILIDIDRFKDINDTYGHGEGDLVIRHTADTLKSGIRPGDALARYGGEEFAVLLPDTAPEQIMTIAERLRTDIEQAAMGGKKIRITASLGIAANQRFESPAELLNRCDRALYRSKGEGRNCVCASAN